MIWVKNMKKFIDFDKYNKIFYDNLWLDDQNFAIKIPLVENNISKGNLKLDKFDLSKYTYLVAYD